MINTSSCLNDTKSRTKPAMRKYSKSISKNCARTFEIHTLISIYFLNQSINFIWNPPLKSNSSIQMQSLLITLIERLTIKFW